MKWYKNNLTKALNIKYPIIQAPMASAASIELATSVTNAGGLGSLGLSYYKLENILPDYQKVLSKTNGSFNLNFMTHKEPRSNESKNKKFKESIKKYFEEYNINKIPSAFLLDPEGRIIAKDTQLRGMNLYNKLSEIF